MDELLLIRINDGDGEARGEADFILPLHSRISNSYIRIQFSIVRTYCIYLQCVANVYVKTKGFLLVMLAVSPAQYVDSMNSAIKPLDSRH